MSVKHAPANAWTVPFGALALLTVLLVAALVGAALGFTHGGRPVSPALTRHPVTRTLKWGGRARFSPHLPLHQVVNQCREYADYCLAAVATVVPYVTV
jgi:hypothetical protein